MGLWRLAVAEDGKTCSVLDESRSTYMDMEVWRCGGCKDSICNTTMEMIGVQICSESQSQHEWRGWRSPARIPAYHCSDWSHVYYSGRGHIHKTTDDPTRYGYYKMDQLAIFNTLDGQVRLGWHRYDYWFSSGESPSMTSAIGEGLMIPSSHRSGYKKQGSRGLEWRGVEETGNTHDVRDPE